MEDGCLFSHHCILAPNQSLHVVGQVGGHNYVLKAEWQAFSKNSQRECGEGTHQQRSLWGLLRSVSQSQMACVPRRQCKMEQRKSDVVLQ